MHASPAPTPVAAAEVSSASPPETLFGSYSPRTRASLLAVHEDYKRHDRLKAIVKGRPPVMSPPSPHIHPSEASPRLDRLKSNSFDGKAPLNIGEDLVEKAGVYATQHVLTLSKSVGSLPTAEKPKDRRSSAVSADSKASSTLSL